MNLKNKHKYEQSLLTDCFSDLSGYINMNSLLRNRNLSGRNFYLLLIVTIDSEINVSNVLLRFYLLYSLMQKLIKLDTKQKLKHH